MDESPTAVPAWIRKRDGRLAPFDADRISQSLFAATEALGRPDAFLARELTDGILHFLVLETAAGIPTTSWVGDLVVKVVRELRQPALAQAYETWLRQQAALPHIETEAAASREIHFHFSPLAAPSQVVEDCLRTYSLEAIYSRDLASAHQEGLLTLTGLEAPLQLASCVLADPTSHGDEVRAMPLPSLAEALSAAHALAGQSVVVDGPEHLANGSDGSAIAALLHELTITARLGKGLHLNVNTATPPSWATQLSGPLFADPARPLHPAISAEFLDGLAEHVVTGEWSGLPVTLDWHVSARDFESGPCRRRLLRLARWACDGGPLAFTFDRPRRAVALGPGLDRKHSAVLLAVGLPLVRLLDLPGVRGDTELLLQKLASLARLARSVGVQKRNFLRQRHREGGSSFVALGRGFLLERARLMVMPIGLEEVVRSMVGSGLGEEARALDLARQIVGRLRDVLWQDGKMCLLETCVDGPSAAALPVTPATPRGTPQQQLRVAGQLHAITGTGTALVLLPRQQTASADALVDLLQFAWKQTDVVRVRFVCQGEPAQAFLA